MDVPVPDINGRALADGMAVSITAAATEADI